MLKVIFLIMYILDIVEVIIKYRLESFTSSKIKGSVFVNEGKLERFVLFDKCT